MMSNQGATSNNDEITEEEGNSATISDSDNTEGNSTSDNNDISEDDVTLFVAYDGKWKYDNKEWFFENSESSIMVIPKRITLSEIADFLNKQFDVDTNLYRLKLEVHYRTGSPWFPVTEIQNDKALSVFISETSKTRLPLCVTRLDAWAIYERITGTVTIFVAYNGKWEYNGEEWVFKNSKRGIMLDVPKPITLSRMTDILRNELYVDKEFYRLKLEVHYRTGSPWFPIIEIQNDQDLLQFISETSKTKVPLCVTRLEDYVPDVDEERRKDNTAKYRLLKAIRKDDWGKAREIIDNNTEEVTWTSKLNDSKLNDDGKTAFHFAIGRYKDKEAVRGIIMGINRELLVTTVDKNGANAAHIAAINGNTEVLKIMVASNRQCLFSPDIFGDLPIHYALMIPAIKTVHYLFKQMQCYEVEFNAFLEGKSSHELLGKVIEAGLIDVAYEFIKIYPSMAAKGFGKDDHPLQRIIRKPDFFYSGADYNLYQRFVYRHVPIENNTLGGTDTADIKNNTLGGTDTADIENNTLDGTYTSDVENQETPKKDKFLSKHTRRYLQDAKLILYALIWRIWVNLWKIATLLHVPHVKHLKMDKVKHNTTIKLLKLVCKEIEETYTSSDIERLYSSPFCLAVENNTVEAIDVLTTFFRGLYNSEKNGQDIFQLTVLNRSERVYIFIMNHKRDAISDLMLTNDIDANNILHLAGHLAPIHKLNAASGAALQMQQELQWFKEVKKLVGITKTRELNDNKETPMMVFRKEHKELRKDGEEWMKKTADSYTITAALIITIVFAAAITVPGGNDNATGKPIYETKSSLIIFAISDAISLFTSATSLLLFLSILTARYADEDFLYKLPNSINIWSCDAIYVSDIHDDSL